ncbi:MAG: Do family serine endopeptidase [Alphaproteobacteria bacterium]
MTDKVMQYFVFLLGILTISLMPANAEEASEPVRVVPENRSQIQFSYAPLFKKVAPSVVNIFAQRAVQNQGFSPLLNDPMFRHFFGDDQLLKSNPTRMQRSLGSGVVIGEEGIIITNYHVIKNAAEIKVVIWDTREYEAEVIAVEPRNDLAALRLKNFKGKLPSLQFKDLDELEVGDPVMAIGNPFGLGQTVTTGIISALARAQAGVSDHRSFIQTDAAINPGNSGGALVSMDGKLVGINTAILSRTGGNIGIGFAIPAVMANAVVDSIKYDGKILRPWLGASVQDVTQEIADAYKQERPIGVIITGIYRGSPAQKAGLQVGDIITELDGREVANPSSYIHRITSQNLNHKLRIKAVTRNGRELIKHAELTPPPESSDKRRVRLSGRHPLSGAYIANMSPALASQLGLSFMDKGVVVLKLDGNSVASRLGLKPGDIVREVNSNPVITIDGLSRQLTRRHKGRWEIVIKRGQQSFRIRTS